MVGYHAGRISWMNGIWEDRDRGKEQTKVYNSAHPFNILLFLISNLLDGIVRLWRKGRLRFCKKLAIFVAGNFIYQFLTADSIFLGLF